MRSLRKLPYILAKERSHTRLLFFLGIIVGILTGVVASFFIISFDYLCSFRGYLLNLFPLSFIWQWGFPIVFSIIFLVVGIWIVRYFAPEAGGSGVHEIEGFLGGKRQLNWFKVLPFKFIAGSITLASGVDLGREGPSIHMGGAIGKMISSRFKVNHEITHILVAAGAGAGLAAAFNAPLSGILFVVEEMHSRFNYSFKSLQCVVVACFCSVFVLRLFFGQAPDLPMSHYFAPPLASLWIFVICGIFFGVLGYIFNRYLVFFLDYFSALSNKSYWIHVVVLAAIIGVLTKVYPDVTGGGYVFNPRVLTFQIPVIALFIIFFVRMLGIWLCCGIGAAGGLFIPMLALGICLGMWFGFFVNYWFPSLIASPGIFSVAGMGAFLAATVGAPLTGIVIVVEMTMNYALILPLIITCFSASMTTYFLGGNPIYEILLERTLRLEQKKNRDNLKQAEKVNRKFCEEHKAT